MNKRFWTMLSVAGTLSASSAISAADQAPAGKSAGRAAPTAEACALLDNPNLTSIMDGLLYYLAKGCGRTAEFFGTAPFESNEPGREAESPNGTDVVTSNPAGDLPATTGQTQSETSIARDPVTGTVCAAWNDSYHGIFEIAGFSGFARSINGGASFTDMGAVNPTANFDDGDPSLLWRKLDGKFYYAALKGGGLGVYRSDDDCQSFTFVANIATGSDDKEIMTADNEPTSPFYGRLYVVWTDFGAGAAIVETHSTNAGATWSAQVALSGGGVQGAWPAVAPNGDVYAAWIQFSPFEAKISRSTNGGVAWTAVTSPMSGQVQPQDSTATANCGRAALKGNIRYLPSPQIAVDSLGNLHAVYSYDPDGLNTGDVSNVYYRKSTNGGTSWSTQVQINDDGTLTDQYQPSLSIGDGNLVAVGYYSKQNDVANNLLLDYYSRVSYDGGGTWQPSTRLSDVSTPVYIDPGLATCYHGDYDSQMHIPGKAIYLWSDDRRIINAHNDPDIYSDSTPAGVDFLAVSGAATQSICVPSDAVFPIDVLQFQGFVEPVTLSLTGNPAPSAVGFSNNPVIPPGTSTLTISNLATVGAGTYAMSLTGTSSPSSIIHSSALELVVYTAPPGASTLTSPANGATQVATTPTFVWTAVANATGYTLELDNDASFATPFYTVNVSATSHALSTALPRGAQVFWRVMALNPCGPSAASGTFSFTASTAVCWQPNLVIPDDPDVSDTRAVSGFSGTITDVNLVLRASHTWVSDMIFRLVHVDTATTVTVIDQVGPSNNCSGDNFDVLLNDEGTGLVDVQCNGTPPAVSGDRIPHTPLSAFDTQSLNGSWRLECADQVGQDTGVLQEWCLEATGVVDGLIFSDNYEFGSTGRWSSTSP